LFVVFLPLWMCPFLRIVLTVSLLLKVLKVTRSIWIFLFLLYPLHVGLLSNFVQLRFDKFVIHNKGLSNAIYVSLPLVFLLNIL
jgi:hypothetical protein